MTNLIPYKTGSGIALPGAIKSPSGLSALFEGTAAWYSSFTIEANLPDFFVASACLPSPFFLASGTPHAGFAAEGGPAWAPRAQIYLTGITQVRKAHGSSDRQQSVLAAAELKFRSETRNWTTSIFAEYRYITDDQEDGVVNLGGSVKHQFGNWDTAVYLFAEKRSGPAESWVYAGRVRYRLSNRHKVGVQSAGAFNASKSPHIAFGYYGSLSESVSLNIIADPGINGVVDFAARMELVWQIR